MKRSQSKKYKLGTYEIENLCHVLTIKERVR